MTQKPGARRHGFTPRQGTRDRVARLFAGQGGPRHLAEVTRKGSSRYSPAALQLALALPMGLEDTVLRPPRVTARGAAALSAARKIVAATLTGGDMAPAVRRVAVPLRRYILALLYRNAILDRQMAVTLHRRRTRGDGFAASADRILAVREALKGVWS